jgi:peptidoglycan/LPS O-acetylase OafA/YrhL
MNLSYSLYVVHYLVSRLLVPALQRAGFVQAASSPDGYSPLLLKPWTGDLVALAYLAAVVGIAWCTWRFIEEPCRGFFNDGLARCPARVPFSRSSP